MIFISHRGNTIGKYPDKENHPKYVLKAVNEGYECEIDVWSVRDRLYLGHDVPQYEVNLEFLQNNKLWCHAKNVNALEYMLLHNVHCFWHQEDDYTITSKGVIWTYPGNKLTNNSICVMPEKFQTSGEDDFSCKGICSDYIKKYKEKND